MSLPLLRALSPYHSWPAPAPRSAARMSPSRLTPRAANLRSATPLPTLRPASSATFAVTVPPRPLVTAAPAANTEPGGKTSPLRTIPHTKDVSVRRRLEGASHRARKHSPFRVFVQRLAEDLSPGEIDDLLRSTGENDRRGGGGGAAGQMMS